MRERIMFVDIGLLDFIYIYHRSNKGVNSGLFQPLSHKWIPICDCRIYCCGKKEKKNMREKIACVDVGLLDFR